MPTLLSRANAGNLALLVACAVLLRLLVGLSSYSGAGTPPKYGDFEAQRHWMEIALHTPVATWYTDGPNNNVSYWPLDYPPLSGYQSWVHGKFVAAVEPAAVALGKSAGYETATSKALLRWTVVASDIAVFFPAALAAASTLLPAKAGQSDAFFVLLALLFNPASVLIDHGHFQYNCISLGLALGAAVVIAAGGRRTPAHIVGSVLFCAALSHKQMSLFYAPAFFAHLLGRCLEQFGAGAKVGAVGVLGVTVIASFAVMWAPWLTSVDELLKVVSRIFPLRRGLYEDYVANWWCATSVVIKWKTIASQVTLARVAAVATLAAATPSMAQQILSPSPIGLLMGMANSAFAFFMFGYQVHEKSILLPLMPLTALAAWEPEIAVWGPLVSSLSMYPLLERDGLALPYIAGLVIYVVIMAELVPSRPPPNKALGHAISAVGIGAMICLHIARAFVPPPARLPWLHDRAFISLSFVVIAVAMLYSNWRQWHLPDGGQLQFVLDDGRGASGRASARLGGRRGFEPKKAKGH